jgi:hypothetical protein
VSGSGEVFADDIGEDPCGCPDAYCRRGCQDGVTSVGLHEGLVPCLEVRRSCHVDPCQYASELRQKDSGGAGSMTTTCCSSSALRICSASPLTIFGASFRNLAAMRFCPAFRRAPGVGQVRIRSTLPGDPGAGREPFPEPGRFGDDEHILGIGFRLTPARVCDPAHRQAGKISDGDARRLRHGRRQRSNGGGLIHDQHHTPVGFEFLQDQAEPALVVRQSLAQSFPAGPVQGDGVAGTRRIPDVPGNWSPWWREGSGSWGWWSVVVAVVDGDAAEVSGEI